jgi:hypothetical protein
MEHPPRPAEEELLAQSDLVAERDEAYRPPTPLFTADTSQLTVNERGMSAPFPPIQPTATNRGILRYEEYHEAEVHISPFPSPVCCIRKP